MGSGVKKVKCPVCGKKTRWKDNPYRPFCSKECKLADLYGWLNEEYKIRLNFDEIEDEYTQEEVDR